MVLEGQTALVTGVGHGLGKAIARKLASDGARIYGADIHADEMDSVAAEFHAEGYAFQGRIVDVSDPEAWHSWVQDVTDRESAMHILVNNAGGVAGQVHHPIEAVTDQDFDRIVQINLYGAFYGIRSVAPMMKQQGYGRIINISSGAGLTHSLTGIQAYSSAKAGQIGLTRQMAFELGPFGITVNNVAPGFVISNPTTHRQWEAMGADGQHNLVQSIPMRRLGEPEDIAAMVAFFAGKEAGYITGQVISVDGGLIMR